MQQNIWMHLFRLLLPGLFMVNACADSGSTFTIILEKENQSPTPSGALPPAKGLSAIVDSVRKVNNLPAMGAREEEKGQISDARREDFKTLDSGYSSPDEINQSQILNIRTDTFPEETIREMYRKIIGHHIERKSA